MKISVAQIHPNPESIGENIERHFRLARLAVEANTDLFVFPELSITSYITESASREATDFDDWCNCLFALQSVFADKTDMTIIVGAPVKAEQSLHISSIIFRPQSEATFLHKHFLHEDEIPFFDAGNWQSSMICWDPNVSLAICYELSVPEHFDRALSEGAEVYMASVANHARGVTKAHKRLAEVAEANSIITMMSNCIGRHESEDLVGQSAAWGRKGQLLGALNDSQEGIIQVDFESEKTLVIPLEG